MLAVRHRPAAKDATLMVGPGTSPDPPWPLATPYVLEKPLGAPRSGWTALWRHLISHDVLCGMVIAV